MQRKFLLSSDKIHHILHCFAMVTQHGYDLLGGPVGRTMLDKRHIKAAFHEYLRDAAVDRI